MCVQSGSVNHKDLYGKSFPAATQGCPLQAIDPTGSLRDLFEDMRARFQRKHEALERRLDQHAENWNVRSTVLEADVRFLSAKIGEVHRSSVSSSSAHSNHDQHGEDAMGPLTTVHVPFVPGAQKDDVHGMEQPTMLLEQAAGSGSISRGTSAAAIPVALLEAELQSLSAKINAILKSSASSSPAHSTHDERDGAVIEPFTTVRIPYVPAAKEDDVPWMAQPTVLLEQFVGSGSISRCATATVNPVALDEIDVRLSCSQSVEVRKSSESSPPARRDDDRHREANIEAFPTVHVPFPPSAQKDDVPWMAQPTVLVKQAAGSVSTGRAKTTAVIPVDISCRTQYQEEGGDPTEVPRSSEPHPSSMTTAQMGDGDTRALIEKLTARFKGTQELLSRAQKKLHQSAGHGESEPRGGSTGTREHRSPRSPTRALPGSICTSGAIDRCMSPSGWSPVPTSQFFPVANRERRSSD